MAGRTRCLSDLPEDAIEKILCRLSIKEAARTSVLSRCWRRRWLSIRNLDLLELYRSQIYQIISHHSGPIHSFKVNETYRCPYQYRYPYWDDDRRKTDRDEKWRSSDLERWLTALSIHSSSSLRTLVLLLYDLTWDSEFISRCFPHITHLELSGYFFVPLEYGGFTSLRGLYLHEFTPETEDDRDCLSRLISSCPLLEWLHLCNQNEYGMSCFSLDITASNLRQLNLNGLQLSHLAVTSMPHLEIACMNTFYPFERDKGGVGIGDCRLVKVFGGMATIKELELDQSVLEFIGRGHVPERITIYFNNLRIISLTDAHFGHEKSMLVLLCLLRSCPNLRELVTSWRYYARKRKAKYDVWNSEGQGDLHMLNNLETVTMSQVMCTRCELSFMKFVLTKAPLLKTVNIRFHRQVKKMNSFVANLLELPRVSDHTQILLSRDSQKTAPKQR